MTNGTIAIQINKIFSIQLRKRTSGRNFNEKQMKQQVAWAMLQVCMLMSLWKWIQNNLWMMQIIILQILQLQQGTEQMAPV